MIHLILIVLLAVPSAAPAITAAFNCGASADYQGSDGILYETDRDYSPGGSGAVGGSASRSAAAVNYGGDNDQQLYETCRRGVEEYRFDLPPGNYIVKLGFAETRYDWKEQVIQDILIEGILKIEDLDVWVEVERNYALEYRFLASVFDGCLNVEFTADCGETFVSSISIRSTIPDGDPPAVPGSVEAVGGYGVNIVSWDVHPEEDVEGFNIYRNIPGEPYGLLNADPVRTPRYLEKAVEPGIEYRYRVSAVDLFGNESRTSPFDEAIPVEDGASDIPSYDIAVTEADLAYLNTHVFEEEYVPALFSGDGVEALDVWLRYGGGVSRHWPKKDLSIRFREYSPGVGAKRINLDGSTEPSLIRERCALALFRRIGLPAPSAAFRLLRMNDEFAGVFTRIEKVDQYFLGAHGLDPQADIYECTGQLRYPADSRDYHKNFEKETNRNRSYRNMIEMSEFIDKAGGDRFRDELGDYFDPDECLTWYATQIFLGNPDFITRNYYLCCEPSVDKWKFIPRNPGLSFGGSPYWTAIDYGTRNSPSWTGGVNPFWDKVISDPHLRRSYCLVLESLIEEFFTFEVTGELIAACADSVRADGGRDTRKPTFEDNAVFEREYVRMLYFAEERIDYILSEIPDFIPPPSVNLFLNEVGILNESLIPDEAGDFDPWLEIYNHSDETVPLDGLILSDGDREWYFPPSESMAPRQHLLVWLDGEPEEGTFHASFVPRPEGGCLRLIDPGSLFENPADSLFYGRGKTDESTGRYRDAGWLFDFLAEPTPEAPNLWNPPFALEVSCSSDSVPIGGYFNLDVTAANLADTTSTVEIVYCYRIDIGVRRPYNADLPLFSVTLPPGEEAGFTVPLILDDRLDPGPVTILVSGLNGEGTAVAESEASLVAAGSPPVRLKINEFAAFNQAGIKDAFDEFDDWIELYNAEEYGFMLSHIYITDDLAEPDMFLLPEVMIPTDRRLLLWADGDTSQGVLHLPFRLDADGGEIGLFLRKGGEFVPLDARIFEEQDPDISEGRETDGAPVWVRFDYPSPGRQNGISGVGGSSE